MARSCVCHAAFEHQQDTAPSGLHWDGKADRDRQIKRNQRSPEPSTKNETVTWRGGGGGERRQEGEGGELMGKQAETGVKEG